MQLVKWLSSENLANAFIMVHRDSSNKESDASLTQTAGNYKFHLPCHLFLLVIFEQEQNMVNQIWRVLT
jgi:hypothetical protein